MDYQKIFKRYELKYLINVEQKMRLLSSMSEYMSIDKYGKSDIRNLYFDTENYRLIRQSLEKPLYKEKLRIRSYGIAFDSDAVFVELKKKYDHVVYKRRISLPYIDANNWLLKNNGRLDLQISREIDYFLNFYEGLSPKAFISYEREAYYMRNGEDFRVTFDSNILGRSTDLSLSSKTYGRSLLGNGEFLMEIKCSGGIPLWMVSALSREKIYKTSFSKYGTFYKNEIIKQGVNNNGKYL